MACFITNKNPFFATLSLMALSLIQLHGAEKASQWLETLRDSRTRARILVLSDSIDRVQAQGLQDAMRDEANFTIPKTAGEKKGTLVDYIGSPSRRWDIIYLNPAFRDIYAQQPGEDQAARMNAVVDAARKRALVVLLEPGHPEVRSNPEDFIILCDSYFSPDTKTAFEKALICRSVPAAPWPQGNLHDPTKLAASPERFEAPKELPLLKAQTATVFRAQEGAWQFNMHPFIAFYEGKFWAIFSSCQRDEDGPGQIIQYATSEDGLSWTEPKVLAPDIDGADGKLRWMPGGLYVRNGKLLALGALHRGGARGRIWDNLRTHQFEWTGTQWRDEGVFAEDCLVYFPPMAIGEGRDFLVWRNEWGHLFTACGDAGGKSWSRKLLPSPLPEYRMSETSSYVDADGAIHLILRDQGYSGRLYRSVSFDNGSTWTMPVKTNYPDCASKNLSGRLSDGSFYLVNNPGKSRDPLSISTSKDGWTFSNPQNIRVNSPPRRYPGLHKPMHSFQYSHAIEHDGKLWVVYSTNKEDIEVTSIPISELVL